MPRKPKRPWPTKAVMAQIYEQHLWGGRHYDFYSGEGSHNDTITLPYLQAVKDFLKHQPQALTVLDAGCGDFNIGRHLVPYTKAYTAVDIVEPLIKRNKMQFNAPHLDFRCLDIARDELPFADVIILRQVLQHLSNPEIFCIVKKLVNYNYVLLTEHLPQGNFDANCAMISGQGIRLKQHSGVDLLAYPFHLKVKEIKVLSEVSFSANNSRIVTYLYKL